MDLEIKAPELPAVDVENNLEEIVHSLIDHHYEKVELEALRQTIITMDRRYREATDILERDNLGLRQSVKRQKNRIDILSIEQSSIRINYKRLRDRLATICDIAAGAA